MHKAHVPDSKLPVCNSLDMNCFRKNKLLFKSRTMLLAYIDSSLKKRNTDFYLQLDGRLKIEDVVKDISDLAMKVLVSQGQRGVSVQHTPYEKVRTCWVKIH